MSHLALEPAGQFRHSALESHAWLVAEPSPRQGDVGEALAHVADPILAADLRLYLLAADHPRPARRDLAGGATLAPPAVLPLPALVVALAREKAGAGHVVDVHEVAPLLA